MKSYFLGSVLAVALVSGLSLGGCKGTGELSLDIDWAAEGGQLTLDAFEKIADATGGKTYASNGAADMPELVGLAMTEGVPAGEAVDIAFVVDTTGSMGDDIDAVKAKLTELIEDLEAQNPDWQVGVVEYRDKGDEFVARTVQPLTSDQELAQAGVSSLSVDGGGDYCEHVYAGLDAAIADLEWRDETVHRIILIGDAPPHDYADDMSTFDGVVAAAEERDVQIYAIGAYCDDLCQVLVSVLGGGGC